MTKIKSIVSNKLIVSLSTSSKIYQLGKDLFLEDSIKKVREEKKGMVGYIHFESLIDDITYDSSIKVENTGVIKGYSCTCENSKEYFGACEHVICCLFYLLDANNFNGTRIKTDYLSDELSKNFKNAFMLENDSSFIDKNSKKFISIVPIIGFTLGKKIYITFKIGTKIGDDTLKNSYIIKNLNNFVKNMNNHEYESYGKNLSFTHNLNKFDEKSKKIIKMLIIEKENIDDATDLISKNNLLVKANNFPSIKELFISKDGFDKLISIFENDEIPPYIVKNEIPPILFKAEILENKLIINKPETKCFMYMGNTNGYAFIDNIIYKISHKCGLCLKFLFDAFDQTQSGFISFKKDNINDFFSYILPVLSKYKLIENNYLNDFYEMGYLPLSPKIYFDLEMKDIHCKLDFEYGETTITYGTSTYYNGFRDTLKEEEILEILFFYGFTLVDEKFVLKSDDDIFQFCKVGISSLENICQIFVTDKFKKIQREKESHEMTFSVKISEDLLKMKIDDSRYTLDELLESLESFKLGKKYYRLKSGSFVDFEDKTLTDAMNVVNIFKDEFDGDEISINKNKSLFIDDIFSQLNVNINRDFSFDSFIEKVKISKNKKIKFPKHLAVTLRNYQKEGVYWLRGLVDVGFGAVLADEMGLGKTIEIIALIEIDKENKDKPYIIICPASLIYNWKHEFEKFSPTTNVELLIGNSVERKILIDEIKGNTVYITTYDTVKRDIDFYNDINFKYVIIDEAQNIKNPATICSKAVKKLKSENSIALTGTPIENSLKELWSIFDFIMPSYLGSLSKFHKIYSMPIMGDNCESSLNLLKTQISPFILRRFKKDVLKELPDKIETVMYAEMTPIQHSVYTSFFKACIGEIQEYKELSQLNIIRKLTRLRQLSCHPSLFLNDYIGGSGKLDMTIETIKNSLCEGHRVLIFSQFTSMLAIIMKSLDENELDYFYLDGKTKPKDRELMCTKFNFGEKDIFLISLKAGGTGLNLTGADVVIHYDPWWNPSVMNQASDRAHRFGQKKIVQVFNFITKDSIEEKIYNLQQKKKTLIDKVLTDDIIHINNLTKDELLNLFIEDLDIND